MGGGGSCHYPSLPVNEYPLSQIEVFPLPTVMLPEGTGAQLTAHRLAEKKIQ